MGSEMCIRDRCTYAIRKPGHRRTTGSPAAYAIRIRTTQYTDPLTGSMGTTDPQYKYAIHNTQTGSQIRCGTANTHYAIRKLGHRCFVDRTYTIHNTQIGSRPCTQYAFMPFNTQIPIHCVNRIVHLSSCLLVYCSNAVVVVCSCMSTVKTQVTAVCTKH